MSRRPSHRRRPARGLVRAHPVLAAVIAVVTALGGAAVVTGTVGGFTAGRRAGLSLPAERAAGPPAGPGSSDGGRTGPQQPAPSASGAPTAAPSASASAVARATAPTTAGATATGEAPRAVPAGCRVTDRLVPTCGRLWGVAPGAYTDLPPTEALAGFEEKTGRPADILHVYHRGDDLFPTRDEQAAAEQGGQRRLILANWKVAWGTTWADVAGGGQDERIDRLSEHLRRNVSGPFYLAVHHEPENDVSTDPESGMTAGDYAAMFRHTVERLRANGVGNAVFVMIYMAYEQWCVQPWFDELWPGDDVVDWVGFDPYLFAEPATYGHGDFDHLVNRTSDPQRWPGFYTWVTRTHGDKPLMIAEWGVFEYASDPSKKAWIYSTVADQLAKYPAIRALVYFDSPDAPKGDTRPDSSAEALTAYRRLAGSSHFDVEVG